jgi:hypothetical protein
MAQQRCGERGRYHHRGSRWRALVVAGACGLLIAACGGDQKAAPTGPLGDPVTPPGQGGGGGGGGSLGPLVGEWLNTLILQLNGDFQRIETTWVFGRDGNCSRTVETFSVLEDRLRISRRSCTYQANTHQLAVLYSDAQENVHFDFSFPEFSRDLLLIDQFLFRRIF